MRHPRGVVLLLLSIIFTLVLIEGLELLPGNNLPSSDTASKAKKIKPVSQDLPSYKTATIPGLDDGFSSSLIAFGIQQTSKSNTLNPPVLQTTTQVAPKPVTITRTIATTTTSAQAAPYSYTTTSQSRPPAYVTSSNSSLGGAFYEIRLCESGDNYSLDTGNGYYGAYQFSLSTWYALGFSGLPSQAPPSLQDQAAQLLYERSGWYSWPGCAYRLGLI